MLFKYCARATELDISAGLLGLLQSSVGGVRWVYALVPKIMPTLNSILYNEKLV